LSPLNAPVFEAMVYGADSTMMTTAIVVFVVASVGVVQ
jgi:hypothetical protein